MNDRIFKKNVEELLFFDIESVSRNEEPEKGTKEYDLYAWSLRDKETNEVPPHKEIVAHYKANAALKPEFNKIVCISVGFIKGSKLYYKALTGDQKTIIEDFYSLLLDTQLDVSGHNIINFDLPVLRLKAFECGVETLPPRKVVDSGAKPWTLAESVFDTMEVSKGTYYYNLSLDAMCMLAGVETPKDDIKGHQVTAAYYNGEIERIAEYCNKDVIASAKLFCALQGDRDRIKECIERDVEVEKTPIIQAISLTKEITKAQEKVLLGKATDLSEEERESFVEIIKAALAKKKFTKKDEDFFDKIRKV